MLQSSIGIFFALATFAVTFLVARTLSKRFRNRRSQEKSQREEALARAGESRQVRRARERKR